MAASMDSAARTRLIALAVLAAVAVALIVVAISSGGGDRKPGGLRVERAPGPTGVPGITVYVEDPGVNEAGTTDGAGTVTLECFDSDGRVAWRSRETWPFTDTDGGIFDPHVHVAVEPAELARIVRCRLKGTDPPLAGRAV
jgi:hypothetical protein